MAENLSQKGSEEERIQLFRYLQGETTFEHYQAWQDMNRESSGLVIQDKPASSQLSREKARAEQTISLPDLILPGTSGMQTSASNTLSVAEVWDYLESDTPDDDNENNEEVLEPEDGGVLDLASTTTRLSSLSKLKDMSGSDSGDVSQVALTVRPDLLAEYLTGKMNFEDFYEKMNKTKEEIQGRRNKRVKLSEEWVDGAEFDDDEEMEDIEASDDDEDYDESFELEEKEKTKKERKKRKPRRRVYELPKHLTGLMGEANLKCAQGHHEEAIRMCMEIIRMAPQASQPYHTLGMIYDQMGDAAKATEFFLLSVHLRRDDIDEWVRVAELLLAQNETKKAIHCYNKAIRYATENKTELMRTRSEIFEQLGEMNKALLGYTMALRNMPLDPSYDEEYLKLARRVYKSYDKMKKTDHAVRVLRTMFQTRPSLISAEDVNMLLELHLSEKEYQTCLEVLVLYCGLEAKLMNDRLWTQSNPLPQDADIKAEPYLLTSVKVPELLPVDLKAKLCICLLHLGFKQIAEEHVSLLLKENTDELGDLFYDVAEAYKENSFCQEALPIFERLVQSSEFNKAKVWLTYAECLNSLGQLEEAVKAFSRVVEMAPNHLGARVSLSALQQQVGKHDEALKVLSADGCGEMSQESHADKMLLLHKAHLLHSQGHVDQFIATGRDLLFSYFEEIYKPGFLNAIFGFRSARHRLEALRSHFSSQGSKLFDKDADKSEGDEKEAGSKISPDELWDLYTKMCNLLLEEGRFEELVQITMLGLAFPPFTADPERNKEAEFMCFIACLLNKNGDFAYNFAKEICLKEFDNTQAWNLFCQAVAFPSDIRYHRFCLRQLAKHPNHTALALMDGHNCIQNGTYKQALGNYVSAFRKMPTDPLVNLCIGVTYIHICGQKFATRKHWLAIQGFAFLNSYLKLRGECQEAYYNLGRAMHQLNLKYAAVFYYKKALEMPPMIKDDNGTFDLKREIAFNLSLIYQASGSVDYARTIIEKYITV